MKLIAIHNPESGVDYHRLILPLNTWEFEDGDHIVRVSVKDTLRASMLEDADILYWCRQCPYNLGTILGLREKYGFKIVVDIDDYWHLYPNHYLMGTWLKNRVSEQIVASLRIADLVITTHRRLQIKAWSYNENVHVVPNSVPVGFGQFVYSNQRENAVLSVGGVSHLQDLRSIDNALKMCGSDPMMKAPLLLCGYRDSPTWNKMLDVAKGFGEWAVRGTLPLESYMNHYNEGSVCIAPLVKNEFNEHKSNLKVIEAGCKKRSIICSAMHPYLEDEVPGVVLCKTQADWYKAIRRLTLNPEIAAEGGEALYEYVRDKYNLLDHNKTRKQLIYGLHNGNKRVRELDSGGD